MDMRAFFEIWFDRFWIKEDMTAADDMAQKNAVVHGLTDAPQVSRDGLRDFGQALLALCDFEVIVIKHFMQDGDWASMLVQFSGKSRANGDPIHFDAQILARAQGDKIAEAYNHPDYFTLFRQLGTIPQDAISRCLCNQPMK